MFLRLCSCPQGIFKDQIKGKHLPVFLPPPFSSCFPSLLLPSHFTHPHPWTESLGGIKGDLSRKYCFSRVLSELTDKYLAKNSRRYNKEQQEQIHRNKMLNGSGEKSFVKHGGEEGERWSVKLRCPALASYSTSIKETPVPAQNGDAIYPKVVCSQSNVWGGCNWCQDLHTHCSHLHHVDDSAGSPPSWHNHHQNLFLYSTSVS